MTDRDLEAFPTFTTLCFQFGMTISSALTGALQYAGISPHITFVSINWSTLCHHTLTTVVQHAWLFLIKYHDLRDAKITLKLFYHDIFTYDHIWINITRDPFAGLQRTQMALRKRRGQVISLSQGWRIQINTSHWHLHLAQWHQLI